MLRLEESTGKLIAVIDVMSEMYSGGFGQWWKPHYREKSRTIKQETPQMGFTV